jgi:eukaryotic-like serine/threonine-protein kinase
MRIAVKSKRWQRVKELFEAALKRSAEERAAFINQACAGDESLRLEVEGLIVSYEQDESFMERPAVAATAHSFLGDQTASLIGKSIGSYKIVREIGRGGMGEVYLAEDIRLGRQVALKLLPSEFTADSSRVRRFAQEARAASALNHPNIITIHEIGEASTENGATHYIVEEYVEGETLRQRMASAPQKEVKPRIEASEAIDIALQIAAALSAAHEAGIMHRDIKPENVMVRRDGIVKVLDFGLAKLTELASGVIDSQASTLARNSTEAGVVMGTPRYMSPEQARGEKVDVRTDIFSLGVMLYEMITGRAPFTGETISEVIAAILRDEPPLLSHIAPATPPELEHIVGRALCKSREERYQTAKDLLTDLKQLQRDLEFSSEERKRLDIRGAPVATPLPAMPGLSAVNDNAATGEQAAAVLPISEKPTKKVSLSARIKWRQKRLLLACVLIIIAAAAPIYLNLKSRWQMPRVTRYTQLTNDGRFKRDLVVTDGARIYFSEQLAGQKSVLAQVSSAGGETVPFHPPLLNADLLAISPDRSRLLIGKFEGAEPEKRLWIVPVTGSPSYHLNDVLAHAATWTPDGEWITYANGGELFQVKNDGSGSRKLMSVSGTIDWPRWSPDGSRLRFTVRNAKTPSPKLWEAAADGSNPHPLLPDWNKPEGECCGSWSADGKYFVFEAVQNRVSNIWALREETGLFRRAGRELVQLTFGPLNFHGPAPAADGRQIFVTGKQHRCELMRYDTNTRQFSPYLSGLSAEGLNFSADGEWITYVTYPEGDLWRSKVDGSERLQLSFPPLRARMPRWSPDGKRIVFQGLLPGKPSKILLVSSEGGNPQQLMSEERAEWDPAWAPDGASLVFDARTASGSRAINLLDLRTNQVSLLSGTTKMFSPRWAPDGRYISALPLDSGKLMLFDFTTREWRDLTQTRVGYPTWSRDGKYIYFTDRFGKEPGVKRVRIADRKVEWVADLKELRLVQTPVGSWFGLAPDDSPLVLRDVGIQDIYALDLQSP